MRILTLLPPKAGGIYERSVAGLRKNYPAAKKDIEEGLKPYIGPQGIFVPCPPNASSVPGIGHDLLKIRVSSSDMKRGKSGGFRVLLVRREGEEWQPILAYAKPVREDVSRKEIIEAIAREGAPIESPEGDSNEAHLAREEGTAEVQPRAAIESPGDEPTEG